MLAFKSGHQYFVVICTGWRMILCTVVAPTWEQKYSPNAELGENVVFRKGSMTLLVSTPSYQLSSHCGADPVYNCLASPSQLFIYD